MALALDDCWCNRLLDVILLFNNTEVVDEFREVLDFDEAGLKDPDNSRWDHYLFQPTIPTYHTQKKVKMLKWIKFNELIRIPWLQGNLSDNIVLFCSSQQLLCPGLSPMMGFLS